MSHPDTPDITALGADFLAESDRLHATLAPHEIRWRDRQQFLRVKGYMLRSRYHVDWVPSWRDTGMHPFDFEDSIPLPLRENLIDATRISDGLLVYIKRVKTGDTESRIAAMFSNEHLRDDPRNHCVPILDSFQDLDDHTISYLVMPFLRLIDNPPFDLVTEVVTFVDQLLEARVNSMFYNYVAYVCFQGLVFIHQQGVAHRDCSRKNLMMAASAMYPHGFHPVNDVLLPNGRHPAFPLPRSEVIVKYYLVDFGISVIIPPDVYPKLVLGDDGRDREPPELSQHAPYDPFKLDIFIIGNVLRREFYDNFSNVDFLSPLIDLMTKDDPAARPAAEEALARWEHVRRGLGIVQKRWKLLPRRANWAYKLFLNVASSFSVPGYLVKCLFGGT